MNIKNLSYCHPIKKDTANFTKKSTQSVKIQDVKGLANSNKITSNYNIAFQGLFKRTHEEIILPYYRTEDVQMTPGKKYEIADDMSFLLGENSYISASEIKNAIKSVQTKENKLIIGRNGCLADKLTDEVSHEHLEITIGKNGRPYARDLNSTNGTKILKNILTVNDIDENEEIPKYRKILVPKNAIIEIADTKITLNENANKPKIGEKALIGRDPTSAICFDSPYMSWHHANVEMTELGYVIEDLGSTNGTKIKTTTGIEEGVKDISHKKYQNTWLEKDEPTIIPNDCQINLGDGLLIDLRNGNIRKLLDERGKIKIERSEEADFEVSEFYTSVSRKHLTLEKRGEKIIATDSGSTFGTEIIPKNNARKFVRGVENLHISQANIGDCFLLSNLFAMSRNKTCAKMLDDMIELDLNGNFHVTFPNTEPITVRANELDGQKDCGKEEKKSVSGDLGVKALERAYARYLIKERNKLFASMMDNKKERRGTMYLDIDQGGVPSKTFERLTGIICNSQITPTVGSIANILNKIAEEGRENFVITCSTYPIQSLNSDFVRNHAYAIGKIDEKNQTVEIINPHDSTEVMIKGWEELAGHINRINYAKVSSY